MKQILILIIFVTFTCHSETYPKVVQFRGSSNKKISGTYELWRNNLLDKSGVIQKFLDEELPGKPERLPWTKKLRQEFPEKVQLLHFNGEARQARQLNRIHQEFFPGHWAYFAGTYLSQDINHNQTVIKVDDPNVFSSVGKRNRFISDNKKSTDINKKIT